MRQFPVRASSMLASDKPSRPLGSTKLRTIWGSGESAKSSVAERPGSCCTMGALASRAALIPKYAPDSSSVPTKGSMLGLPGTRMLYMTCGTTARPHTPDASCQARQSPSPPLPAPSAPLLLLLLGPSAPESLAALMRRAVKVRPATAAYTALLMQPAMTTCVSTRRLLSMPTTCTFTALRSPRFTKWLHMSVLPSKPLT
mmetsp:Transcript_16163/g.35003  ORF Transcript_16163/g.35003 Transcript_16163/m.35003 type:complete len:200 (-) Transcript_16163:604-1203(-)